MGVDTSVDPDLCIGSGDCIRIVPSAFQLDDDASVSHPTPAAATSDLDLLLEAARSCPTQAIRIVRDDAVLHDANKGNRAATRQPHG